MIYNIQTYCTYGYWPEDLKSKSGKPIVAACDDCGKIRITSKNIYRNLCISCSNKKRYKDPKEREKTSKAQQKRYEDPLDPLEREKTSKAGLKYYENNSVSNKIKEKQSKAVLKRYENNPVSDETKERQSKAQQKRFENPLEREKAREKTIKHFEDPLEREKQSKNTLKVYENDPTIIERISKSVKSHYAKMDDPGQEIIKHHYIYDFNDLTKYTIPVTRSEHTIIHWNLKRAGLEVPHINIMKVTE